MNNARGAADAGRCCAAEIITSGLAKTFGSIARAIRPRHSGASERAEASGRSSTDQPAGKMSAGKGACVEAEPGISSERRTGPATCKAAAVWRRMGAVSGLARPVPIQNGGMRRGTLSHSKRCCAVLTRSMAFQHGSALASQVLCQGNRAENVFCNRDLLAGLPAMQPRALLVV